jgi:glycosyltransferase involved in cell wall biosynthesis
MERLADRIETLRDRMEERTVTPAALAEALAREGGVAVLDVLATPMEPRFGGVPVQLAQRLPEERRLRATALLSPEGGRWTLRVATGGRRLRTRLGPVVSEKHPSRGHGAAAEIVVQAARLAGARVVNFEGVSGWPPEALRSLTEGFRGGRKVVLSLHDFALFCPRPNLLEEPSGRFCGYSRDEARCGACLASTWRLPAGFVEAWREVSAGLLSAVDAVVYPTEFLRRQHAVLFPEVRPRLERVIAPPAPAGVDPEGAGLPQGRPSSRRAGEPFRVAFVGAYRPHKGALVFESLLRRDTGGTDRAVAWSILGSGDPALLLEARRLGARVAGHYRAGGLTRLLLDEEIDLALLLSLWPETYALTLSECHAAGVPVLAFALGAIADRVRSEGGGILVPPEEGADGVAATIEKVRTHSLGFPPFRGIGPGTSASRAAAERSDLYRTLLGGEP